MPDAFDRVVARTTHPTRPVLVARPAARFEPGRTPRFDEVETFHERRHRTAEPPQAETATPALMRAADQPAAAVVPAPVVEKVGFDQEPVPQAAPPTIANLAAEPGPAAVPLARTVAAASPEIRVLEPAELLTEHIAPMLVETRALTQQEAERLVAVPPAQAHDARTDGLNPVALQPVEVPASGDVHVHIDRLEIRRNAAPAPAPTAAPRKPVDHGEYLARQRDRWAR